MTASIRWRLAMWNASALAVVLACFAVLVYVLLRHALFEQTDRLLQAGLAQLTRDPGIEVNTDHRLRHWIEEYKDHQNLFCVIYRRAGTLYGRTADLQVDVPIPVGKADRWLYTERFPGIGRQRIMAERMRLGEQEFVVMLLAPLESVDRELSQVRVVLVAAGPIALLLSAALAYWLARKALVPVDKLRREADAITVDHLNQRLATPNPQDELGVLASTINAMIARLERSFAEIRRFTADASHELRTPLTALRTEVEVALGKQLTLDQHQHLLGNVLEELVRMSRLTDQLLTLSRRDAGVEQMNPCPVNLASLVAGVVSAMQPVAEARGISLLLEEGPVTVSGEEARLRQVFINLLDNALKYTPGGGRVIVRVGQAGRAIVSIEDTGIGIPPEHLPHVFDRFYRVDKARSRSEGGTGLGLSIASSIVKAHGGTIEMTSVQGQGTICKVSFEVRPI